MSFGRKYLKVLNLLAFSLFIKEFGQKILQRL